MKTRHSCLDFAAYETESFSSLVSILNLLQTYVLDTVTDFLIKLGIKPRMHLLEISIFLLLSDLPKL